MPRAISLSVLEAVGESDAPPKWLAAALRRLAPVWSLHSFADVDRAANLACAAT